MKKNILSLVAAGLTGGLMVALAIGLFGLGTQKTTVYQSSSGGAAVPVSNVSTQTPREIYKRDAPGVVFISSTVVEQSQDPFGYGGQQRGQATGSGFVIDKSGLILTNYHVVNGATEIKVGFDDTKTATARLVGKDPSTDLALLKVDPSGLDLHPLTLGSSKNLQVGDPVLAIGNPFNLDRTLTTGVVSALQRRITAPNNFQIDNVIQTDAAINPGNSGGPLLNSDGQVVGINSQIETGNTGASGNVGIGFAVPIDTAKKILPTLSAGKRVERGWLGVETQTVDQSLSSLKLGATSGALIEKLVAGSPAAKAGLVGGNRQVTLDGQTVLTGGDIIVEVDGQPIKSSDDLATAIGADPPGKKIEVKVVRGKDTVTKTVTLEPRPSKL